MTDPMETVGTRGGAVLLPLDPTRVETYARLADAMQTIAEGQRLALPLSGGARMARGPFNAAWFDDLLPIAPGSF